MFLLGEFTFPVVPTGLPNARVTVSFSLGSVAETDVHASGRTHPRDDTDAERALVLLEGEAEFDVI